MPPFIDVSGQRFGRLVAIERAFRPESPKRTYWRCQCDCGATAIIEQSRLKRGETRSCGCRKRELLAFGPHHSHGMTGSREHTAWLSMRRRCTNPNTTAYPHYGGRGIKICDRWLRSFEAFYADMGPAPSPRHSIDRIDNDGDYEPGNCRWVTQREQMRNQRTNRLITYQGTTLPLVDWAKRSGISAGRIRRRIESGWSVERALTTPIKR